MPRPKTNFQIGRMFGLARKAQHGFDDDHDYLASVALEVTNGRTSHLSKLFYDEANAIIVKLGGDAVTTRPVSRRTENYRKQVAGVKTIETDAQLKKIDELAAMRGWSQESLAKFCRRVIKKDSPATTEEGNKIVEGLKAMNRRDGLIGFPVRTGSRSDRVSSQSQIKFRRIA